MPKSHVAQNVRVGVFVCAALAVFALAVAVIGQERSMFVSKTHLYTSFADVNGLVVGAPVRLAGMDVGRVTRLSFATSLDQPDARLELAIENHYMSRVRSDSRAYIDSKGLLGDKLINLTVGGPSAAPLHEGDYVHPKQSLSFEAIAKQLDTTASSIAHTAERASVAVDGLASPEISNNLRRASGSLAVMLERVERGNGLAHDLLFDPSYAARASRALDATASSAQRLDALLARVEHGPGALHTVLYEDDLSSTLAALQHASSGMADIVDQVDHGPGLAQSLLRDPAGAQLVKDLADVGARLDRITAHVERGEGSLGGLLVDPSVYEDMKTVLGNIERNTLLKALIRLTIKRDGITRPAIEANTEGAR